MKIMVVDPLTNDEGKEIQNLPFQQKIVVSGITASFENEVALSKYFSSAQRSGGGEIVAVECHGNGKASITFKDPTGLLYWYCCCC